jgi:hypothetical protein
MVNAFQLASVGKPFEKASVIVYSQVPLLRLDAPFEGNAEWIHSQGGVLEEHERSSGVLEYWKY